MVVIWAVEQPPFTVTGKVAWSSEAIEMIMNGIKQIDGLLIGVRSTPIALSLQKNNTFILLSSFQRSLLFKYYFGPSAA